MENQVARGGGVAQNVPTSIGGSLIPRGSHLPLNIVLEVPILGFTVRSLLGLEPGSIVQTSAQHNDDLMVHANGQLVGMAKFDVTGDVLAVRLTEVL